MVFGPATSIKSRCRVASFALKRGKQSPRDSIAYNEGQYAGLLFTKPRRLNTGLPRIFSSFNPGSAQLHSTVRTKMESDDEDLRAAIAASLGRAPSPIQSLQQQLLTVLSYSPSRVIQGYLAKPRKGTLR